MKRVVRTASSSPWRSGHGVRLAIRRSRVRIPTVEAFFRSPSKTPSTGSSPRKRTREHFK
ncbi:hypothetical protein DPMN_063274 [Dreissena polymorpha]|uniref:Uncharacterized protein n=1 Tax=Dreissena polymorpha TaxID=45954 RepID=A0A9D4HIX9_DREPO|nr:hypothetical protein DPMN_063274 [Dreissena polymorpha]